MIVTCPQCSKRYMLDDTLLPQEGRQVRCVACHHVWRQAPDASSLGSHSPLVGIPDIVPEARTSSEKQSSWLWWIVCLAIILSFMSFLSFGRNFVVKMWPQSERIYEYIGLHISLPGAGLSIDNASSQVQQDGSIEMIRLTGDVINMSEQVRPIPSLKIKAMGEATHPKCLKNQQGEGCILDYWEHRFSENSLLPGKQIRFETEPRPKVEGTQHISVEF